MKTCTCCGESKAVDDFHNNRRARDGKQPACKPCTLARNAAWKSRNMEVVLQGKREHYRGNVVQYRRNQRSYSLRTKYGITSAAFDAMMLAQDGRCAICTRSFAAKTPAVDHDHTTGVVRGLLCRNCNVGLGLFGDDAQRTRSAANYLDAACQSH